MSVSVTDTLKVPAVLGVPDTDNVAELVPDAVTPVGSPVTFHVYDFDPPEAVSEPVYAVPTVPLAGNVPVMVRVGSLLPHPIN